MDCVVCMDDVIDPCACLRCFQVYCLNCAEQNNYFYGSGSCPKCRYSNGASWFRKIPTESSFYKGIEFIKQFGDLEILDSTITMEKAIEMTKIYVNFIQEVQDLRYIKEQIEIAENVELKFPRIDILEEETSFYEQQCVLIKREREALCEEEKRISKLRQETAELAEKMIQQRIQNYNEKMKKVRKQLETDIEKFQTDKIHWEQEKRRVEVAKSHIKADQQRYRTQLHEQMQVILDQKKIDVIAEATQEAQKIIATAEAKAAEIERSMSQEYDDRFTELEEMRARYDKARQMERDASKRMQLADSVREEYNTLKRKLDKDIEVKRHIFENAKKIQRTIQEIKNQKRESQRIYDHVVKMRDEFEKDKCNLMQYVGKIMQDQKAAIRKVNEQAYARYAANADVDLLGIDGMMEYVDSIKHLAKQATELTKNPSLARGKALAQDLVQIMQDKVRKDFKKERRYK